MNEIKFIPGVHPTFTQQFNKLTEAYINHNVDPMAPCACFVGTLLNGNADWQFVRETNLICTGTWRLKEILDDSSIAIKNGMDAIHLHSNGLYTPEDIAYMESVFLWEIKQTGGNLMAWQDDEYGEVIEESKITDRDEAALFIAFEKTLDLLKQIHLAKGEVIDTIPKFIKRTINDQSQVPAVSHT